MGKPTARPPRPLRHLEDRLRALPQVARRRQAQPRRCPTPARPRPRGPHRLGRLLRRRHLRPGLPRRRGCPKKGGAAAKATRAGEPEDHAAGAVAWWSATRFTSWLTAEACRWRSCSRPGSTTSSTAFEAAMDAVSVARERGRPRQRPRRVLADAAYDADRAVVPAARHRHHDQGERVPEAQAGPSVRLRPGAERGRAHDRAPQGALPRRVALGEAGGELPGDGAGGVHSALPPAPRITGHCVGV